MIPKNTEELTEWPIQPGAEEGEAFLGYLIGIGVVQNDPNGDWDTKAATTPYISTTYNSKETHYALPTWEAEEILMQLITALLEAMKSNLWEFTQTETCHGKYWVFRTEDGGYRIDLP